MVGRLLSLIVNLSLDFTLLSFYSQFDVKWLGKLYLSWLPENRIFGFMLITLLIVPRLYGTGFRVATQIAGFSVSVV